MLTTFKAVYPLVARPTEVEWIEMNFEEGKKSMSGPSVRIVDMKRKSAWESADPATTVDIVPIQSSQETSAIIIPVNVVSITPGKILTHLVVYFLLTSLCLTTFMSFSNFTKMRLKKAI